MLKQYLSKIDLFGIPYGFKEYEDQNFHTMLGGILSLATFIAFFVISLIFGKEIFTKSNPIVNSTKTKLTSEETRIGLSNLPLVFYFESDTGVHIKDITEYFEVDLYETSITPKHTISEPFKISNVSHICTSDDIHFNYKSFLDYEVNKGLYTCINYTNLNVKNDLHVPDSNFLSMYVNKCNPKNEKCKDFFEEYSTLRIYI